MIRTPMPWQENELRALAFVRARRRLRSKEMTSAFLYWSKKGQVACATHAPMPGSPQWADGGWRELVAPWSRVRYQCQHCAPTPVAHERRAVQAGDATAGATPDTR
jgi:hypothetical protein